MAILGGIRLCSLRAKVSNGRNFGESPDIESAIGLATDLRCHLIDTFVKPLTTVLFCGESRIKDEPEVAQSQEDARQTKPGWSG
jgi:hypothetical protein